MRPDDGPTLSSLAELKSEVAVDGGVGAATRVEAGPSTDALDRRFVRGIAWQGGVKWGVQIVTWGTTIAVARILSPSDYGLLSMGNVLLTFITLLSESGLGITVVRTRPITSDQIAQINGAAVLLGLACFAVAATAAFPVSWFYRAPQLPPVIIAMSAALVISSFRVVPGALLQRDLRFPRLAVIDGAQGLLQASATVVLAILGFRYWSLVLGALLGAALSTIATVAMRPYRISRPRRSTLRPLFSFTREVVAARLLWYTYQDADFVVAGRRLGLQALGGYQYAWSLASLPIDKITALVASVTSPVFAAVQNEAGAMRRYFLSVTEGLAVVSFPLTIGMALVARELVPVVLGEKWAFMALTLQVLAVYASIRSITPIASQALTVMGETRIQMYLGVAAVAGLPTAFYIGSHWGAVGIAVAWSIAHPVFVYIPFTIRVFKRLGLSLATYLRALWPAISGCAAMTVAVILMRALAAGSVGRAGLLAIEVVAGGIAYSVWLLLFHGERVAKFRGLWRQESV